ncbi:hypothetical protein Ancab_002641, partial [Ancistrocladus abbreviatus]
LVVPEYRAALVDAGKSPPHRFHLSEWPNNTRRPENSSVFTAPVVPEYRASGVHSYVGEPNIVIILCLIMMI